MNESAYSDNELLALLQEKLPQELNEQEVDALRDAIQGSPEVRESLVESLGLEHGVAATFAPELQDIQALLQRLEREAGPRHSRWQTITWFAVVLSCLAGGAAFFVHVSGKFRDAGIASMEVARNNPPDVAPVTPESDTPENPKKVPPDVAPGETITDKLPERLPPDLVSIPAAAVPVEPPWRVFDDGTQRSGELWHENLHHVLLPIGGAIARPGKRSGELELRGSFAVAPPGPDGRSVRLRIVGFKRLRWSFWRGAEGTLVEWKPDEQRLLAFAVRRGDANSLPNFVDDAKNLDVLRSGQIERIDPNINFAWNKKPAGIETERFSATWRGFLHFPEHGTWNLHVTSAGSVAVHFGSYGFLHRGAVEQPATIVKDIWFPGGEPPERPPRVKEIQISYTGSVGDQLRLEWERSKNKKLPLIARHVIPAKAFRGPPHQPDSVPQGLTATYYPDPDIDYLGPLKVLHLVGDDQSVWSNRHQLGTIDVRYEAGAVRLVRGDRELLTLPMEQPPEQFLMEIDGQLRHAILHRLPPLEIKDRLASRREAISSSALKWNINSKADKSTSHVTSSPTSDGKAVRFVRTDGALSWDAFTTIERKTGCEVTMRVDAATVGTGVVIRNPSYAEGSLRLYVGEHDGVRVLCQKPTDPTDTEAHHRRGWIIGKSFWVRYVVGLCDVRLEFSNNGVNWVPASQQLFVPNHPVGPLVHFGVTAVEGPGERALRIGELRVRRFQGLERLAEPELVAQAGKLLNDTPKAPADWTVRYKSLIESRPEDVPLASWEIACRLAMLTASTPSPLRQQHVLDLLRAAMLHEANWKRLESALLEVPRRVNLSEHPFNWGHLAGLYEETAQSYCSHTDRQRRIPDLTDTWHRQELGLKQLAVHTQFHPFPLELARLNLHVLAGADDPQRLWAAALREEFLSTNSNGHPHYHREHILRLALWMQRQAVEHLMHDGDNSDDDDPHDVLMMTKGLAALGRLYRVEWGHPLAVESPSRELMNLFQEIRFAIDAKDWPRASETLVRKPLLSKLASGIHSDEMLVSLEVAVRQWIEQHPELAKAMRDKERLGRLRLNRAIKNSDVPLLESVALQFHGTGLANEAQARLADRELSMREFLCAGERYRRLIEISPEKEKAHWKARRRLAMALAGQQVEEPPTVPVALSGRNLSPSQFEAIVSRLLTARASGNVESGRSIDRRAPGFQALTETRAWKLEAPVPVWHRLDGRPRWSHRPVDFGCALEGEVLYIHQPGRLTACNMASGKTQVILSQPIKSSWWMTKELARPLVLGSKLLVPFYWEDRFELTCIERSTGKVLWRQPFDDTVLGEPVECGGTILTLSLKRQSGLSGVVTLRRVDPATGQALLSREVARVALGDPTFRVGRPVIHQGNVLLRVGCSVICCDLFGRLQWLRQLPFTSPSVEQHYYNKRVSGDLLVAGDHVIIASPGSWNVECRSIETGQRRWSYLQPQLHKVVGLTGDRVILAVEGEIQALDVGTGEVVWRVPWKGNARSLLLTEDDAVLAPVQEQSGEQKSVQFRCFQAADGAPLSPPALSESKTPLAGVDRMFTDGRRIVCARQIHQGNGVWQLEITVLEAADPSP